MYYKVPKGPSIHHVSDPSSFFYLKYTINKTMHILISTFLFLIRCKRVFCNVTDICNHAPPQHSDDLDLSAVPCYDPALRRLQVGKTMPVPPPSPPRSPVWFIMHCHVCLGIFNSSNSMSKLPGRVAAVGNVSGYRCVSDCRSRGREFDPGPVPYFRGD